jgi:hypothetical protein
MDINDSIPVPPLLQAAADLCANAETRINADGTFTIASLLVDPDDHYRCFGCGGNTCAHSEAAQALDKALESARLHHLQGTLARRESHLLRALCAGTPDLFILNTLHIHLKAVQHVQAEATAARLADCTADDLEALEIAARADGDETLLAAVAIHKAEQPAWWAGAAA